MNPMMNHNNPPSEMEILQERLAGYDNIYTEFDRLSKREIPEEITSDEQAGGISDYLKSVKNLEKDIDAAFKKEKAPFWDCCQAADRWKRENLSKTAVLIGNASKPVLAWNKKKEEAERKRQLEIAIKAREEAEALAAEAAAHAKEGIDDTAAELMDAAIQEEAKSEAIMNNAIHGVKGKSRGTFGTTSTRKVWTGHVDSLAALDLEALRKYIAVDDLNKAIKAAIRDGVRDIRGAKIYEEEKLSVR